MEADPKPRNRIVNYPGPEIEKIQGANLMNWYACVFADTTRAVENKYSTGLDKATFYSDDFIDFLTEVLSQELVKIREIEIDKLGEGAKSGKVNKLLDIFLSELWDYFEGKGILKGEGNNKIDPAEFDILDIKLMRGLLVKTLLSPPVTPDSLFKKVENTQTRVGEEVNDTLKS